MTRSDQPLGHDLLTKLVSCADQFESSVRSGHDVMAAAVALSIVQILGRYFPAALSSACSSGTHLADGPGFLKSPSNAISPPDVPYLAIVQPAVQRFKEALLLGDILRAIQALGPTGILAEGDSPQRAVEGLESELAKAGGTRRLEFLPRLAKLALWAGDADKAEQYAKEAVGLARPADGEATHDGNMVLGLFALHRGDTEQARRQLIQSSRTSGSTYMKLTGPNLSLANELLKRGEREAVVEYLGECRRWFEGRKPLDTWIEKIRNGDDPPFDPLYLS